MTWNTSWTRRCFALLEVNLPSPGALVRGRTLHFTRRVGNAV
jgi:hypothetical protein